MESFYSDKRLKTISDIINGIKTIKAYAWELPFVKLVNKFRNKMVSHLFRSDLVESSIWGLGT